MGSEYLSEEELKHTLKCYCDRCGTELRIHLLFPLIGSKSLEHACVARRPEDRGALIKYELIEVKPMDIPVSKIFELDSVRDLRELGKDKP